MAHIVLVGAANMGFAMLSRWLAEPQDTSAVVEPAVLQRCRMNSRHTFSVVEPVDALRERAAKTGARVYAQAEHLSAMPTPDILIIATKPQSVGDVAERYSTLLAPDGLFVSVAAGIDIATIEKSAGGSFPVIRCMPNTPASIGEGMIVCCSNTKVSVNHREIAQELLSTIGKVVFVDDESLMDAVTAVSGSGPAYLFLFIEALSQAARSVGLDDELALLLAKQTVYGASKLAMESSEPPSTLRRQVTSSNGTTAAGLDVLLRPGSGLTVLINQAVSAAKNRSMKLGKT